MNETALSHYGQWGAVVIWIIIYGVFLLFLPFYKKSQRKPTTAYVAFIIAYAFEMFGIPLSMYFVAWAFGRNLPDGILWGHTLNQYIGNWGMYVCIVFTIIGGLFVIFGWRAIHKNYWRYESGEGKLVDTGIYKYIRHPQYTGFLLITLGMIFEWATIPLLIMWPILFIVYYRLARKEEQDMTREFGEQYVAYKKRTGMFLPKLKKDL
ncbi:methyltransferase family protein [Xiamenia xianingshaonis]|uniref:DUF1295 domain-containing protein n=1 Tax=Xiamenia xianingshaonis TaxID=2682776 RepID=A0A9E6MRK9_9ACTN|nr:isoprenylcysteine carboxylmethyltransferase family protein [Xiamenia xianingshaonis]NHM13730.1 DUF1295 domain-containing protein [Xiamenia xianingshaonis]QTU85098.1 isoprenylcysteine carboxylmethyltransferase family protein [Xiamenia xianingshaonis]